MEGLGEGLFWFIFLFPFQILTQNFLKILNKLLTTQSIKTHAFNMMHKHLVSLN
jgi:hypothetical protein